MRSVPLTLSILFSAIAVFASEIREFDVDRPSETTREGRLRSAGKALLLELRAQLVAERVPTAVQRARAEDEEPEPRGGADRSETGGGV